MSRGRAKTNVKDTKRVYIQLPTEAHTLAKLYAAKKGMALTDFFYAALRDRLRMEALTSSAQAQVNATFEVDI